MIRQLALVGLLALLPGLVGCIPVQNEYWSGTIEAGAEPRCKGSKEGVSCSLPGNVTIFAGIGGSKTIQSAVFAIELPAGHVAHLTSETATLIAPDGSSQALMIVSADGFRYRSPNSWERIQDAPGVEVTRELVGSTRNAKHHEQYYGLYRFDLIGTEPFTARTVLQLPEVIVDGVPFVMPVVTFEFGKKLEMEGLFRT